MNQLKDTTSPLELMLQQQIIERGITDERVIDAMRSTPRDLFFPRDIALFQPKPAIELNCRIELRAANDVGPNAGHRQAEQGQANGENYEVCERDPMSRASAPATRRQSGNQRREPSRSGLACHPH